MSPNFNSNSETLILGEAPSHRAPEAPFSLKTVTGRRLAQLLGAPPTSVPGVRVDNIFRTPQPRKPKGSSFPHGRAVAELRRRLKAGELSERIVLAGERAAAAFFEAAGVPSVAPLSWARVGSADVSWIPHPSGVNRFWNAPSNCEAVSMFLRNTVAGSV